VTTPTEAGQPDLGQLSDQLANATEQLTTVSAALGGVQSIVSELTRKLRQSRLIITALAVSFVLDIVLTGGLTFLAVRQQGIVTHQQQQADQIQQVQTRTSQQVLCPFFRLVIGFQRPTTAQNYPLGRDAYNAAIDQMKLSYQALQCH
jgi:hypothetical protein